MARITRTARILLLSVAAVLLTSCIRIDVGIDVRDDGSGTLRLVSALDVARIEEMAGMFGDEAGFDEGPSIREQVEALGAGDLPSGATASYYSQDGFEGVEVVAEFGPGDDLLRLLDEGLAATPGEDDGFIGDGGLFETFVLERDGDGWRFEASLPAAEELAEDEGMPLEMIEAFIGRPELRVAIRMPGRQVDHNADRIERDGTLVWEFGLIEPGERRMFARTVPGDPITGAGGGGDDDGLSPVVIGLLVAAVVLGVAAVVVALRQRRPAGAPPAPSG